MDNAKRILTIALLLAGLSELYGQEEKLASRDVERQSLELYQAGNWKELIRFANEALSQGIDYYYLRIRAGVACFETKRYMKAALHFEIALSFSENDFVAGEYLYGCYMELNRSSEAYKIYDKLPASSKEKLNKNLPKLRLVSIEEGLINSNQMEKTENLDLDGEDNLYGEADITQEGNYFSAGLGWGFRQGNSVFGSYSNVTLNKDKIAEIGDTISLDDQYRLKQHQVYLSGNIPLGKGYSVLPAFNMVMGSYEQVMPQLKDDSSGYIFPLQEFSYTDYIGYLSVTKDFNIVQITLSAAYSNLNDKQQFQAGFQALVYPFGNLNLYSSSKLMNHMNDGVHHILFEQMVGTRFTRNLWAEVNATFGTMQNYYEKNAFVVYNIADEIEFKGGANIIYMIYPSWMITLEYIYLQRRGQYTYYSQQEDDEAVEVNAPLDFGNNIFILGFNWKF
jgi:hypothetical protein